MLADPNELPEADQGLSAVLVACLEALDHGQALSSATATACRWRRR